jgi:subtilase family serine protease
MYETTFYSRRLIAAFIGLSAVGGALYAQAPPRITGQIDNSAVVRIAGTTHPWATAANDAGRAAADLPMDRILLQLKSSPDQQAALEQLLADQQDPSSARYHQWLTPRQFGEQFGVAQQDLDTITAWLESQGFRVTEAATGKRSMEFSGTARNVEQAFHTEMHRYTVNGESHIANNSDISIPAALAGVVEGVVKLNDFRPKPLHHTVRQMPLTDLTGGAHALAPYDFATIYNVLPLWSGGFDGAGQSIAVAGHTNLNPTDITTFRSTFGLSGNNTQIMVNGANPGIISSSEEAEADLDVEWSGAVAKGAAIKFVVSADTNASDGVTLSSAYIVNNNLASAMSLSFGACEASMGTENPFFNNLWSQAAAEGISVFVAAGDSGSAGCDAPQTTNAKGVNTTTPASQGFAVNGLASTPYNVAVGGTEFNDTASPSTYWNSTNSAQEASAIGYIPEVAWNESSYTTAGASGNGLWAGAGGVSTLWATPAWQTGSGVPAADPGAATQHHRYLPDVSLTAAGHDGYLIYQEGKLYLVGGTSATAPSFAGIMAMVDQHSGGRNGNPNQRFYPLAASTPSVYHDTTTGTNAVPCEGGSRNCSATTAGAIGVMDGYSAGKGFDLATGWGSVDAYELALNWGATGTPVLTINSLSPNPMTASSAAQVLTISGAGFASGAKVTVGSATYSGAQLTLTATQIQLPVTEAAAGSYNVQVANSNGQTSNVVALQVNAPVVTPVISSLSPNPVTGSNSLQTLTIKGTGFQSGATVQLSYTGATANAEVLSVSSTQIQALINVGTTARTWTVKVTNPGGAVSAGASLVVTAPAAPTITALSPNPMTHSTANQTLTITGAGFQTGAQVQLSYPGAYENAIVSSVTATQIQAIVNVGNTPRAWSVVVTNPGGGSSSAATLTVR